MAPLWRRMLDRYQKPYGTPRACSSRCQRRAVVGLAGCCNCYKLCFIIVITLIHGSKQRPCLNQLNVRFRFLCGE